MKTLPITPPVIIIITTIEGNLVTNYFTLLLYHGSLPWGGEVWFVSLGIHVAYQTMDASALDFPISPLLIWLFYLPFPCILYPIGPSSTWAIHIYYDGISYPLIVTTIISWSLEYLSNYCTPPPQITPPNYLYCLPI